MAKKTDLMYGMGFTIKDIYFVICFSIISKGAAPYRFKPIYANIESLYKLGIMGLKSKLTLVLSVCMTSLFSQTFNWNAYPTNSTNWVPVANFSVTTATSGGGSFDRRSSNTAATSPISGTDGSTAQNCGTYAGLRLEMSGAGNSLGTAVWNNNITVTINFPTFLCAPVTFSIYDITETFTNFSGDNYVNYQDKVTISALDNNNNPVTPGATVAGGIDNNVVGTSRVLIANGTGAQCTNQNITVGTTGQQIRQITIVYSNQDLPTHCPAPVGSPPRYGISQYQYVFISPITGTAPPTAAISSPTLPCGVTATTFTASTSAASPTYSWSGPGGSVITSPTASVTAVSGAGVYTLTINPGGCSSTATFAIGSGGTPPSVTTSTSNPITCTTTTAQVIASTASTPVTYNWSGPGIVSGASTATAVVNAGGTYNYTVTNTSTGCSTTGTLAVTQNTSVVTATANATSSLSCNTTTTQATLTTTTSPATYTWSGPGIVSGASTATAVVNAGGTYNYTVTDSNNGCRTSGSLAITQNTTQPTVTPSSTSLTCNTTTAQAAASTAVSPANYSWTGPGIVSGSSTGTVIVNTGGTYNYTVTNPANGCLRTGTVAVTQNTATPQVSVSVTSTLTCNTLSTQVIATTTTSPATYTWTGPGIVSGAGTATLTVNAGGSYEYTVTNTSNGCKTSGLLDVIQNTVVVTASATANSTISCTSSTAQAVISTTTSPASYSWSGPGIVSGGSTATVTANAGGTYNYTVTNTSNGCFTTGSVAISQNTANITASATAGSTITCNTTSVQATISTTATPVTYSWSGPGIVSGASSASVTVNTGGTYNYTVTNTSNGCSVTGTLAVAQNTTAPAATASNATLTCANTSTVITGGPASGVSYSWNGPGISGATNMATATVTITGNYTLTTTGTVNGCTNTAVATVTNNLAQPVTNAGSTQTLVCGSASVTLSGNATPAGSSANWLGGVCGSATAFTTTACAPGVYTLVATHPVSGCTSSSTVSVESATNVPQATVNAITNSITCTNSVVTIGVTLSNSDPVTYSWSGPGITGSTTTNTTTTNMAGTYSVTITNTSSGCQSVYTAVVPSNTTVVTASVAPSASLTCTSNTVTLSATPAGAGYTYSWSGPGTIQNGTTENPTVNAGGDYSVIITDNSNGCSGSYTVNVPSNTTAPTASLAANSVSTTCASPTVTLNASSDVDPNATYTWTTPSTGSLDNTGINNPTASGSGVFTVVVTNTINGCTSAQQTVTVTADANLPVLTASAGNTVICSGAAVSLSVAGTDTYTWSANASSANTQTVVVNPTVTTTYSVSGTNTVTGCSNNTSITIHVTVTPTISITATTTSVCEGSSTTFTLSGATSYTVNNPTVITSSTVVVSPTVATTYTINGETAGCAGNTETITINVNSLPAVAANNATTCAGTAATLSASGADNYTWLPGSVTGSTISITPTGNTTYSVSGTNTLTGCTSTLTEVSVSVNALPTVTATANPNITCASGTVNLAVTTSATSYTWATGNGVTTGNQNQQTITFPASGLTTGIYVYTVSVTGADGCLSLPATTTLNIIDVPNAEFNLSDLSICLNSNGSLSINNPQTGATYDWSVNGQTITNVNPLTIPASVTGNTGTYTVSVIAGIGSCTNTAANTVTVMPLPVVALVNATTSACENASAQLDVANPNSGNAYVWTYNTQAVANGPGLTVSPLTSANNGNYTVTATDANGCSNSATGFIDMQLCETFVPEIFTPNGDGKNDGFVIKNIENYPNNNLKIFNRWGNLVYEKDGYLNEFDGFANTGDAVGKSKLPSGTYYVILVYGDEKTETYNGYLLLQY